MRWTYDACSNADLEEVAFAVMGVSAILEYVDLSSAPRDATYAAMCLLGVLGKRARRGDRVACLCGR